MLLFVVFITQTGVLAVHVGTTNGKLKDANLYNEDPEIVKTYHEWYQLQKAEEVRGRTPLCYVILQPQTSPIYSNYSLICSNY